MEVFWIHPTETSGQTQNLLKEGCLGSPTGPDTSETWPPTDSWILSLNIPSSNRPEYGNSGGRENQNDLLKHQIYTLFQEALKIYLNTIKAGSKPNISDPYCILKVQQRGGELKQGTVVNDGSQRTERRTLSAVL